MAFALKAIAAQPTLAAPAGKIVATRSFSSSVVAVAVDTGYDRTYVVTAPWNTDTTVL